MSEISISGIWDFLPHQGSRIGFPHEPPSAKFTIEGGSFGGVVYPGATFTPTVPAVGASRVDIAFADPNSGTVLHLEGTEGSEDPPSIDAYSGAAPIAHITVLCRDNGKVVIETSDIKDLRTLLSSRKPKFELLGYCVLPVGAASPSVNATVGPFKVVNAKGLHQRSVDVDTGKTLLAAGNWFAYVDIEYPDAVVDLHLVATQYNTLIAAAPNKSGDFPNGVGITWEPLPAVDGNPRFRVWAAAAEGVQPKRVLFLHSAVGEKKIFHDNTALVLIQAWGRTS